MITFRPQPFNVNEDNLYEVDFTARMPSPVAFGAPKAYLVNPSGTRAAITDPTVSGKVLQANVLKADIGGTTGIWYLEIEPHLDNGDNEFARVPLEVIS